MASNKKNELIVKTYEMLKTTSPSDIKIRNIASACNCTTPVIYKYFDDLDHLVRFAAIRFLENYIIDLQESANSNSSPLDMLISMWDSFAKYAFENVDTTLRTLIRQEVIAALRKWEPRIFNIQVTFEQNLQEGALLVNISYEILSTGASAQISVPLNIL